jgi:hypothetical protein
MDQRPEYTLSNSEAFALSDNLHPKQGWIFEFFDTKQGWIFEFFDIKQGWIFEKKCSKYGWIFEFYL